MDGVDILKDLCGVHHYDLDEQEVAVTHAYWALAQYEFAYDPKRVRRAVAKDTLFLSVFDWNDSEDNEE